MFPGEGGTELESRFLRSARRFRSDKRRKTLFRRGSCNKKQEEERYEFTSYLDEGSCDEEEEYHPISEGDEESEESTKSPEQEHGHDSPAVLEVISPNQSPSISINMSSTNVINSEQ